MHSRLNFGPLGNGSSNTLQHNRTNLIRIRLAIILLGDPVEALSPALAGSKFRGHPGHCKVMSVRMPITRFDPGTFMEIRMLFHSQFPFQSRDLACLSHKRRQFDMAPRGLHPACQGMEYEVHVEAQSCVCLTIQVILGRAQLSRVA